MIHNLKNFKYVYDKGSGPLPEDRLKDEDFAEGNCRLAIQYYLYKLKNIYLKPEEVLLPNGYRNIGTFIFKEEPLDFNKLKDGDIIYAQNLRNKKEELLDRSKDKYKNEDEWILYLHSAVYTGEKGQEIWHATAIEGGSCFWSLEKFVHYYQPVAVKRIN